MISICIPIYKGSSVLGDAIQSIINQDYTDFEIIITDDNHPQDIFEIKKTKEIIENFKDHRIKYFKNEKNLGYAINLKKAVSLSQGEILFLFAQDDILAKNTLSSIARGFEDPQVGVITRPYVWFQNNLKNIVRSIEPYNKKEDSLIDIKKDWQGFHSVCQGVGQLSGLAYKKEYLKEPFDDKCFTAHIYPFLDICKRYKCLYLKNYTVAVRIETSQTRHLSNIYDPSPTGSWIEMFDKIFKDGEYSQLKKWGYKHICKDHLSLVQIKNYAPIKCWFKEIYILVKNYPLNLISPRYWFFVFGTLLVPRPVLIKLVDLYKQKINKKMLPKISFDYDDK